MMEFWPSATMTRSACRVRTPFGLEILKFNGCQLIGRHNVRCPLSQIVDCLAVWRRGAGQRWIVPALQTVEVRPQSVIEHIPASNVQRDIENALDVRVYVKDVETWA